MNDYMNQKWRNFLNETRNPRPRPRKLVEKSAPKAAAVGKVKQTTKTIAYPQFRITDEYGEIGTKGREDAEMFFSHVTKEPGDMRSKIEAINKFLDPELTEENIKEMPIDQVLGTLVTLDVFSAIVHKFDPSGAGFLFEGFMAALFGGKGKQVKTDDPEGGIEDIWDFNGEYVSLKLLAGGKLDGSIKDLRWTIEQNDGAPIRYIFAKKMSNKGSKEVNAIEFYEFTVGTDGREWDWQTSSQRSDGEGAYNYLPATTQTPRGETPMVTADAWVPTKDAPKGWLTPAEKKSGYYQKDRTYYQKKGNKYVGGEEERQGYKWDKGTLDSEGNCPEEGPCPKEPSTWEKVPLSPEERRAAFGQTPSGAPRRSKLKTKRSWSGSDAPRFEIASASIAKSAKVGSVYHIGTIKFGDEKFIKSIAEKFAVRLQNGISQIYDSLQTLTDGINQFLMENNATSGQTAVAAAGELVDNTNCVVKKKECKVKEK